MGWLKKYTEGGWMDKYQEGGTIPIAQQGGPTPVVPLNQDYMNDRYKDYTNFYSKFNIPPREYSNDDGFDAYYHHTVDNLPKIKTKVSGWNVVQPGLNYFQQETDKNNLPNISKKAKATWTDNHEDEYDNPNKTLNYNIADSLLSYYNSVKNPLHGFSKFYQQGGTIPKAQEGEVFHPITNPNGDKLKTNLKLLEKPKTSNYTPSKAVVNTKAAAATASIVAGPAAGYFPQLVGVGGDLMTAGKYALDGQWENAGIDLGQAVLGLIPASAYLGMGMKGEKMYKSLHGIRAAQTTSDVSAINDAKNNYQKGGTIKAQGGKSFEDITGIKPIKSVSQQSENQPINKVDAQLVRDLAPNQYENKSSLKSISKKDFNKTASVKDVLLNPMTALKYKVQGQNIPANFTRGERNPLDYAIDAVNPFMFVNAAGNTVGNLAHPINTLSTLGKAGTNLLTNMTDGQNAFDDGSNEKALGILGDVAIAGSIKGTLKNASNIYDKQFNSILFIRFLCLGNKKGTHKFKIVIFVIN